MEYAHMSIRAVICDIYHTLLAVNPPPADAEASWVAFWRTTEDSATPPLTLEEFSAATEAAIARQRAIARANGIQHPEIFWPDIVSEALPELRRMSPARRNEFLWQQAQHLHTVQLMPGAIDALHRAQAKGLALGLASNSQPYTLRELDTALASGGLTRQLFDPALCFFSFEHGFSKPNPEVFLFLTDRLHSRGIEPSETVMVGNRLENDILPAQSLGWQTWHFTEQASAKNGAEGNWSQFTSWLV
jgi:FMN phosphatase YigB (HAD superfamily)